MLRSVFKSSIVKITTWMTCRLRKQSAVVDGLWVSHSDLISSGALPSQRPTATADLCQTHVIPPAAWCQSVPHLILWTLLDWLVLSLVVEHPPHPPPLSCLRPQCQDLLWSHQQLDLQNSQHLLFLLVSWFSWWSGGVVPDNIHC